VDRVGSVFGGGHWTSSSRGILRDGGRASEMGWLHPIGRGENHIASQAMSRSLISAQKTNGDPEIAMEMADGTKDHGV